MVVSKEYLKKYINRVIQGKVEWSEIQTLKATLANYSREEWKELIAVGKELAGEAITEALNKSENIPAHWKTPLQDFALANLNFFLAIFNEEVFYQSAQLEKQGGGLSEKEQIIKLLPVISHQMDKISAGAASFAGQPSYPVEKNLYQAKTKTFAGKILNILKSLKGEEIEIVKGKLNRLGLKLIQTYAPAQVKNSPEMMGLIKSSLSLMDAMGEESLIRDWFKLCAKGFEDFRQAGGGSNGWNFSVTFNNPSLEADLKNWLVRYTQHINKLASLGAQTPSLSASQKEALYQKLGASLPSDSPNPDDSGEFSWTNNLVVKGFGKSLDNLDSGEEGKKLTGKDLLRELEKELTTVETKPKWYQNPWVIWPSLIGAAVAGGLITWLFLRKKETKKEWKE